jgi:hypothetical protein
MLSSLGSDQDQDLAAAFFGDLPAMALVDHPPIPESDRKTFSQRGSKPAVVMCTDGPTTIAVPFNAYATMGHLRSRTNDRPPVRTILHGSLAERPYPDRRAATENLPKAIDKSIG